MDKSRFLGLSIVTMISLLAFSMTPFAQGGQDNISICEAPTNDTELNQLLCQGESLLSHITPENATMPTRPEMRMDLEFGNYNYRDGYTSLCTGDIRIPVDPGFDPSNADEEYLKGFNDAQKDSQLDPRGFMIFCYEQVYGS